MTDVLTRDARDRRLKRIVGLRLEPELYDRVEAAATADGRNVSNWLRKLIDDRLAEGEQK